MATTRKQARPAAKKVGLAGQLGTARPNLQLLNEPVRVSAQASFHDGNHRLYVAISVHDQDGTPVEGLTKARFKLWHLGPMFREVSITTVMSLGTLPTLAGHYQLVKEQWGNGLTAGTHALCVQVVRNGKLAGSTFTSVVQGASEPR